MRGWRGWWLVGHGLVLGAVGLALYLAPANVASWWPWPLPPLAARFIASLFIGVGAILVVAARGHGPEARRAIPALSLAAMVVPLSGWLGAGDVASIPGLAVLSVLVAVPAAVDLVACAPDVRAPRDPRALLQPPWLRGFFAVHLLLVLPVGASMVFVPERITDLWPWTLTLINLRLVGAIFLGSAILSGWAMARRPIRAVEPILAGYLAFGSLALAAIAIHVALFDRGAIRSVLFVGLYVYVVVGAASGLIAARRASTRPA